MKILHTADWHIGKKLHKQDLFSDFDYFIDWLVKCIQENKIDLVLVSGDVFDLANPSHEAKTQYYQSLLKLKSLGIQLIITGGNHDSPSMLNAPKKLLAEMNIHIIGGMPENPIEALIPITDQTGNVKLVVAAIPYLRNTDIQHQEIAKNYEERLERLKQGISLHFNNLAKLAKEKYSSVPCIAMGHLFAKGVSTSESERDIQIGNQAGIEASQFGNYFNYIALGHIHQPQQVKSNTPIYYSGSPIQLSFSERKDQKRVLMLDTKQGFQPISIPIPSFRKLIKIKGGFESVKNQLKTLPEPSKLKNLIEIELTEKAYQPSLTFKLNELIEAFNEPEFEIVKHRIYFEEVQNQLGDTEAKSQQLEELQAKEVFDKKLNEVNLGVKERKLVELAFTELLNEIEES